jgi:membrane protease YdiL (CAAX protease family)
MGVSGLQVSRGVHTKRRDAIELIGALLLILLVVWTPRPYQRVLYWAPVAWIAWFTWLSFTGWHAMGWRIVNLLRSLWVVGLALALAAVAAVVSSRYGALHAPPSAALLVKTFWGYAIWSYAQQFMLLDFFLARSLRLTSKSIYAVCAAAGVFSLVHLPNPALVPLTAIWGFAACLIYLKYRNLWTMGMAHAIFGIAVAVTLPATVTHNMRVGLGYMRFHPRLREAEPAQRRNSDQIVSTEAWVMDDAATRRLARQLLP